MAAVAEIVVKSSRILLGLLTTGKLDSYITTYNGSCPSSFNKISKASRAGQKCQAGWIQARELYVGHPYSIRCSNTAVTYASTKPPPNAVSQPAE